MGHMACTEPQCLCKGALYLYHPTQKQFWNGHHFIEIDYRAKLHFFKEIFYQLCTYNLECTHVPI